MKWTTEEREAKAAAREAETRATKTSETEARAAEARAEAGADAQSIEEVAAELVEEVEDRKPVKKPRWTIVELIRLVDCVYAQCYAGFTKYAWFPFEEDFGRTAGQIADKWVVREKWLPSIDMTKDEVDANVAYLKKLKDCGDRHSNLKRANPKKVDMYEVHKLLKQKDDLESS